MRDADVTRCLQKDSAISLGLNENDNDFIYGIQSASKIQKYWRHMILVLFLLAGQFCKANRERGEEGEKERDFKTRSPSRKEKELTAPL